MNPEDLEPGIQGETLNDLTVVTAGSSVSDETRVVPDTEDTVVADPDLTRVKPRGRRSAVAEESVEETQVRQRQAPLDTTRPPDESENAPDSEQTMLVGSDGNARRKPGPWSRSRALLIPVVLPPGTAPVSGAFEPQGPGSLETYGPRDIPAPPDTVAPLIPEVEASRMPAPAMPSVLRASRRAGTWTQVLLVVAILVSLGGLVWISFLLFGQ